MGGTPLPPFTDKIRKVVFEVPPYVIHIKNYPCCGIFDDVHITYVH